MKKILYAAVGASLALPAVAATPRVDATRQGTALFPFAPQARTEQTASPFGSPSISGLVKDSGTAPRIGALKGLTPNNLPEATIIGYLDGPKNENWYYCGDYTYTDGQITGFHLDIYDATFKKIGSVRDNIELQENETRVAEVSIGPAVTQKFFNYDNNYEVMVAVATNTTEYVNNYRTCVYSITSLADEQLSDCKQSIDGYYVSAINTAQDAWSENFFITFMTEEETNTPQIGDVINVADYRFVTYKKAGYSGDMVPVLDVRIPQITLAGADAIPFLATQKDGVPYFCVNHLKYSWFLDPYDYTNDTPTPDNELIAELYAPASSFASTADLYSTTRFPLGATDEDLYFLYLGSFSYNGDVDMTRNDDGTPTFIVTRAHSQQGGDSYLYDFEAYDGAKKGEDGAAARKYVIGTGTEGGYFMSDIAGFDPQVMLLFQNGGSYGFQFVNILDGTVEHTIPFGFNEGSDDYNMNAMVDRIPSGNSYLYTVPQSKGFSDENGDWHSSIVFASPEGDIVKVDDINMGKNVAYANIYPGADSFNPYLFNLDADHEYMVLIKRYNADGTGTHEELSVISANPDKGVLLNLGPDEEKGDINNVSLVNTATDNPSLAVTYINRIPGSWKYTTTYFDLPLTLFEAGDGTAENPYEISTVGGLMQIKSAPEAYFAVVADIDADGVVVNSPDFNFTGSLDGRGHVISNLTVSGRALLPVVSGELPQTEEEGDTPEMVYTKGVVKNLKFYNAKMDATVDAQGLLVGRLTSGLVNNVHFYNSKITSTESVGGIVGNAVSYSMVSECSFDGEIVSPENSVGGIVCTTTTSSSVNACAFKGSIEGGSDVGGILGSVGPNGNGVVNSHVKADIKGKNTIGGIVGTAAKVPFNNNHVEGTLTATEALSWGGGCKVGGIAGSYPNIYSVDDGEGAEVTPMICNNFVNLSSITAPEPEEGAYPAENNSVHRVVGYTRANYAEEVDYDEETYEPIYGDPFPADETIRNNYVVSTLPIVESAVADDPDSTEGKSMDASELTRDFFEEQLGFAYGYDSESPWAISSAESAPALYFESVLLLIDPRNLSVGVDEEATVKITVYGEEISESLFEDFTCDYNESLLEMTDMAMTEDGVLLTLKGLAPGECDLTVGIKGQTVKAHVTVSEKSGLENITAEEGVKLTFNASILTAEGASIEVFNISGVKVLAGHDSVGTGNLASGVYIAVAKDGKGSSALKFRVK